MAEIVNLRLARKRKARRESEAAAALNRGQSGRSKSEKAASARVLEIETRRLEAHLLETPQPPRGNE